VVSAVIGTVLLAGCSEKQEANDTLPSPSAAETTEELPEVGPADFPVPDEARTKDAAGAEAFVRYYFELINYTSSTLDAEPLRQLSDGCDDCDRIATNAEENAKAGNRYEGGHITVTEMAPPLVENDTADMAIRIDQTTLVIRDAAGSQVEEGSSEPLTGVSGSVALTWKSAVKSWVMTYMAFG
jgi:hypothetical protein